MKNFRNGTTVDYPMTAGSTIKISEDQMQRIRSEDNDFIQVTSEESPFKNERLKSISSNRELPSVEQPP